MRTYEFVHVLEPLLIYYEYEWRKQIYGENPRLYF